MPEAPVPRPKRVKNDGQALFDDKKGIVPMALRSLPWSLILGIVVVLITAATALLFKSL